MLNPHFNAVREFLKCSYWVVLAFVLLLTAKVYSIGLSGPFVFDDFINIVNNQSLRLSDLSWDSLKNAATFIPNGMFGRPLSMLTFAFDYYKEGDQQILSRPHAFKTTNLIIHLTNGWVLYILTGLLAHANLNLRPTQCECSYARLLSLAVASAWLLHPLNLTAVLYVVQRMTSLATLFTMSGMVCYMLGRTRLGQQQSGAYSLLVVAAVVFTPLAFLCKEIGILLPAYLALLEILLFRKNELLGQQRRFLRIYFILLFWMPLALGIYYFIGHSTGFLNGYERRDFSMVERLLTEARVVCFYLYQTVLPNIAMMGLFHDDFHLSRSIMKPVSTALALGGLLSLLIAIFAMRKTQPLVAFGLALFLVGHSLESTFIPLEIMHEHRNYLPSIGLLIAAFSLLLSPNIAVTTLKWRRMAVAVLLMLFTTITMSRVAEWSSAKSLWEAETTHHPESIRAHLALGNYYANALTFDPLTREDHFVRSMDAYERALLLDKRNTNALFGILKLGKTFERPVDTRYIEALRSNLMQGALPADTNDRFIDLALCVGQDHCPVTASQFEDLLAAALSNVKLRGRDLALIYSAQTFYFANVAHDYPKALISTRQAIVLDGDIEHQIWLANILIAMHDFASAKQQIILLRQLDTYRGREKEIAILESQIDTMTR